ncbi:peptide deformylase [Aestuariispira ectoiniformans]|uniref:peptide deformylase n=1 Tax=Aestuariispira ectoiniformans TaxID=2775080 RepID=UPI00223AECF9|nr:peptide deformylase [Aestuariispira ectoiniformans]
MAVLPILVAPNPVLKKKAEPVEKVDAEIVQLMNDMLDTMYDAPGIGLAAPQVGVSKRILVMDVSRDDEEAKPLRMANPEVIWESEELMTYEEGCLSFPEQYAEVDRPAQVKVRFLDENNETREIEADGLLATCVQHEIDHLDGVVFVDHISTVKRGMIMRKLKKLQKLKAAAE